MTITAWLLLTVASRAALDSALYIWQFEWTDAVRQAIRDVDGEGHTFMVLTSEWSLDQSNHLQQHDATVDWSLFESKGLVPVIRMHGSLTPWVENRCQVLAEALGRKDSALRGTAASHGVSLGPLQLDYDCPTSRLTDYRRLLAALDRPVTITTLPTWLSSSKFAPLVRETAGYILQLHSLDPPQSPTDLGSIFSPTPDTHIEHASHLGRPFHVALPTYGYAYHFDANGVFQRLEAEDTASPWQPASGRRILMADPARVAATVGNITASPPPHCRGIAWFRMPVAGEDLNWHPSTLAAVMKGKAPQLDIHAELKESEGRWECWLSNHGTADPWGRGTHFRVRWTEGYPLAMQGLGGFEVAREGRLAQWSGPAPRVGSPPQLVGWMRFAADSPPPTMSTAQLTGDPSP